MLRDDFKAWFEEFVISQSQPDRLVLMNPITDPEQIIREQEKIKFALFLKTVAVETYLN